MSRYLLTLDVGLAEARARIIEVIEALGWRVKEELTRDDQIACYVPIPDLLPRAPVYFVSLYSAFDYETDVALIAANDDLSERYADDDLPLLFNAIQTGPPSLLTVPASPPLPAATGGRCFVSYRRHDSADAAGRIYDRLVARYGPDRVFKDVDSIPLGADFRAVISEAVGACDVLLAVIGRDWLTAADDQGARRLDDPADFVRIEIETALQRGIPVIPLLVRDASIPPEEALPDSLRDLVYRNGIRIRSDPDFHSDMDRLIAALDAML